MRRVDMRRRLRSSRPTLWDSVEPVERKARVATPIRYRKRSDTGTPFANADEGYKSGDSGIPFRLGTSPRQFKMQAGNVGGQTDEECAACLNYPTNLTKVAGSDFDRIAHHGYEIARMTMGTYRRRNTDAVGC
jgi:hypothetical protein